jgi:hypothetical protein
MYRIHVGRVAVGVVVALGLVAGSVSAPLVGTAWAQDGPRFGGQWGPNMAPPGAEGIDSPSGAGSGSTSGSSSGSTARPGEYQIQVGPEVAPGRVAPPQSRAITGCNFDLRGNWWSEGRFSNAPFSPYSVGVFVRQYRGGWLQVEQDDGTTMFGRCLGSRIEMDAYNGSRYVGYQNATVSSDGWSVDASWRTFNGAGRETWYR